LSRPTQQQQRHGRQEQQAAAAAADEQQDKLVFSTNLLCAPALAACVAAKAQVTATALLLRLTKKEVRAGCRRIE
jgi:hypothetical protein